MKKIIAAILLGVITMGVNAQISVKGTDNKTYTVYTQAQVDAKVKAATDAITASQTALKTAQSAITTLQSQSATYAAAISALPTFTKMRQGNYDSISNFTKYYSALNNSFWKQSLSIDTLRGNDIAIRKDVTDTRSVVDVAIGWIKQFTSLLQSILPK